MNDDQPSLLASFVPPAILFGFVWWMARGSSGDLGDDAPYVLPPNAGAPHEPEMRIPSNRWKSQTQRHAARKLYGSAVLAAQAAGSMEKLARSTRDRDVAQHALALQAMSKRLLTSASRYDSTFVSAKVSR